MTPRTEVRIGDCLEWQGQLGVVSFLRTSGTPMPIDLSVGHWAGFVLETSQALSAPYHGHIADRIQNGLRFLAPVRVGDVISDGGTRAVITEPLSNGSYRCTDGTARFWDHLNSETWARIRRGHVSDYIASGLRALTGPRTRVTLLGAPSPETVFTADADALFAPLQAQPDPPFPVT